MEFAVNAARWVLGKALAPVVDGALEAWQASTELGSNIAALKMELLYAQGMLDSTEGRELRSPALKELLLSLQELAFDADDALDELDYFRVQDSVEDTFKAADEDPRGRIRDAALHVGAAVEHLLRPSSQSQQAHADTASPEPDGTEQEEARQAVACCAWRRRGRQMTRGSASSLPNINPQPDAKVRGGARKLASSVLHTVRDVGKHFTCCSSPPILAAVDSGVLDTTTPPAPPQQESVVAPDSANCGILDATTPAPEQTCKLKFRRAKMSKRVKYIADQFKPLCDKIAVILNLELLESNRRMARDIAANLNAPRLREEQGKEIILPQNDFKTRPITRPYISEPNFCGRKEETDKILRIITGGDDCRGKGLIVLPIVGLGGMGKTTLAKHIYDKVEKDFDVRIWICVSVNFGVPRLFKEIVEQIPKAKDESQDTPIETRIETQLKSNKFFLVLDDMWNCVDKEDWDTLIAPLRKGQTEGNVILVTSRFPKIAQMIKTIDDEVELEGLKGPAFKELFIKCVFDNNDESKSHRELLNTTGKEIMEKLKGSPLAAKTVGRLLRNHLERSHWERILHSKEWEMQTGDHDIMPALKISYDFLPFHLQRCFSFCALFPEDYKFNTNELIHWWIGLDILQSDRQNKSVEDIGLDNLENLVIHGFLKKDKIDGHPRYLMHDLLHDLCLKVVSRECLSIDRSNVTSVEIWPSVRHLCIIIDDAINDDLLICQNFISELKKLETRLKIENLRTLMIFGLLDSSLISFFCDLIRKAKSLRVLHLSGATNNSGVELSMLVDISPLAHLRYLSLENIETSTFCSVEPRLPSMLSKLYHLRILDMQEWPGDLDLIRGISNLTKLRHIVTKSAIQFTSKKKNKYAIQKIHPAIRNMGKLQYLHELYFEVNNESNEFGLNQLGNLMDLTELGIYYLGEVRNKKEAAEAKLVDKNRLLKLTLDWSSAENDVGGKILEALQPHKNLQELCIRSHGSHSCPTWLGRKLSVRALKSLHLYGVRWEVLPFLGHMEELHELKLKYVDTLKEFAPCHFGGITLRSFCNLKSLELVSLEKLEKWVLWEEHGNLFCQLEVLIIKDCPNLLALPFTDDVCYPPRKDQEVKIHRFPKLQKLKIIACPKVSPLPPIPWTQTLCSVKIDEVDYSWKREKNKELGPWVLDSLIYKKSPSNVQLEIHGKDKLHSLNEKMLVFVNLRDLQMLKLDNCPPLEFKHLQMLTSLKSLHIAQSLLSIPLLEIDSAKWQLPVEHLFVSQCPITGKELTQLISRLPKLSELEISSCGKITQVGVAVKQQLLRAAHIPPPPSISAVRMDNTQATCHQQDIVEEEVEEIGKVYHDELLLLPIHLSGKLRRLSMTCFPELMRLLAYPPLHNKTSKTEEGGWLHALRSLQELEIHDCKLLSAHLFSSVRYPFPSSLKKLKLWGVKGLRTLKPLSNLTCLTELDLFLRGEELRGEGRLWPLVTQGQLSILSAMGVHKFFVVSDPLRGLQRQDQEHLRQSCKLQELRTNDPTGFLDKTICTMLSFSLTKLQLGGNDRFVSFTEEQEKALQLLASLQDLTFRWFPKLQYLPAMLHTLTELKLLWIDICECVSSLPEHGLPDSLLQLHLTTRISADKDVFRRQCEDYVREHPRIKLILM